MAGTTIEFKYRSLGDYIGAAGEGKLEISVNSVIGSAIPLMAFPFFDEFPTIQKKLK